jgi:hypothetical protein
MANADTFKKGIAELAVKVAQEKAAKETPANVLEFKAALARKAAEKKAKKEKELANAAAAAAGGGGGGAAAGGGGGGATTQFTENAINGIMNWDARDPTLPENKHEYTQDHKGAMIYIYDNRGNVLIANEGVNPLINNTAVFVQQKKGLDLSNYDNVLLLATTFKNTKLNDQLFIDYFNKIKTKGVGNIDDVKIPLDFQEFTSSPPPGSLPEPASGHRYYKFYLRYLKDKSIFGVPKGGKKDSENELQTIQREVWEEIGIRNLPIDRLHYHGILDTKNYSIFSLKVSDTERDEILKIIEYRENMKFGETFNIQFDTFSNKKLNKLTREGRELVNTIVMKSGIILGGKRRIAHKRTRKTKRRTNKKSRNTRRR